MLRGILDTFKDNLMRVDDSMTSGSNPVTIAVIGCGQRGRNYADFSLHFPESSKVVSIAEPRQYAREETAKAHNLDPDLVFRTWADFRAFSARALNTTGRRLADAVVVAVQDQMHCGVVLECALQGYHILCEKPMATTVEDCVRITDAVKKAGVIFGMGHVLRYSPYSNALAEVIKSGSLGRLINIQHMEPIGYYHFAHSYVRGNWRNEEDSSFSLMTKSCHDIDIICSMMAPDRPSRVSSFGSLQHFRKSEKPPAAGSATRCLDCPAEGDCPYSARSIYLDRVKRGERHWPVSVIVDEIPDIENVTAALQNGPYGKCVYESDNDVVDNQVVNIEFASGATASFTMVAFTSLTCDRQTRLHFSHGEIAGNMTSFTMANFRERSLKVVRPEVDPFSGSHSGGDRALFHAFIRAVRSGRQELLGTDPDEILRSHLTVFAAEKSRRESRIVDVAQFEKEAKLAYQDERRN